MKIIEDHRTKRKFKLKNTIIKKKAGNTKYKIDGSNRFALNT